MDSNTGVLLNNKFTFDLQFQSRETALDAILYEKGTSLVYNPIFLNVFATKKTKPPYKCGIFQYLQYTCLGLFISFFQIKLSQSLSTNISNFHFIITSCLCISLFMLYFSTISILFFMQIIKVRHSLSFWGWITFRVCNHQTKNRNQKAKIYVDHFQINRRSAGPHRRIFQLKHQTNH